MGSQACPFVHCPVVQAAGSVYELHSESALCTQVVSDQNFLGKFLTQHFQEQLLGQYGSALCITFAGAGWRKSREERAECPSFDPHQRGNMKTENS